MVKHIILWQLKEELSAEEKANIKKEIKSGLEALVGKQHENVRARVHTGDEHHHVPEV